MTDVPVNGPKKANFPADPHEWIQTTGIGNRNRPSLVAGSDGFATSGVASPLSVSIKSRDAGASPTIINLAEDLISILAFSENVWPICAPLCLCQLVGLR